MQKPSLGRIVLVIVDPSSNNGSVLAPAVITRVWPDTDLVNVRVIRDTPGDLESRTSMKLVDDEDAAHAAGASITCFWPPRV
jgi:hypothetical protein